jgi:hypothetical protein
MRGRRVFLGAVFWAALGLAAGRGGTALAQAPAAAAQDWKKEFEDICGKTQDAMALPLEELKTLVSRCDKLKPQLEKLDESQRKVYSRRLQVCRDLYQFVIESRPQGSAG